MSFTDIAICLRRSDFSETSLVLRLMTRQHGQVALLAKGVKRPKSRFGGSIDLLTVGQAVFTLPRENSASTLGLLTAWDQTAVYPCLRTDLLRHAAAITAGELLGRLTEELDPHPASFDAILRLLEAFQAGEPPIRRLAEFGRVVLADVGLTPGLDRCVGCGAEIQHVAQPPSAVNVAQPPSAVNGREAAGSPSSTGTHPKAGVPHQTHPRAGVPQSEFLFSGARGGVLCPACRPAPGEGTRAISWNLKDFFTLGQLSSGKLALEIVRWLVYYVQHQIGRELSSAAALDQAIAAALAAHARKR